MRTIGILVAMIFSCAGAGPATQPTTQPHEETVIERAYRRLHARQAAEAAAATQPAAPMNRKRHSYPWEVADEMNDVLGTELPVGATSALLINIWRTDTKKVEDIGRKHVGEVWEVSGSVEDVEEPTGPANADISKLGAVANFRVMLPVSDKVFSAVSAKIQSTNRSSASARERVAILENIRSSVRGRIEVEGTLADFLKWRRGQYVTAWVRTKEILPEVSYPRRAAPGIPDQVELDDDLGMDYLKSVIFKCTIEKDAPTSRPAAR